MKTVIVTGANGFIGKTLCKELIKRDIKVYALVREKEKLKDIDSPFLNVINLDMENYVRLGDYIKEPVDVCFHFAWNGTFGQPLQDYELQINNIKLACDTICVMNKIGVRKFIFAGTVNELEIKGFLEKDSFEPRLAAIYGTAKLTSEMLLKILAFSFGMEINVGLIGSTYGEGDYSKMVQNVLINHFLKGKSPKLISGETLYDWVYIDDIIAGFISIAEKGINQKTYYIGHQNQRTFKQIVTEVRDLINPDIELNFGEIKEKTRIDFSKIDAHALGKDTGYSPKADFRESILKTAEWVKSLNWDI